MPNRTNTRMGLGPATQELHVVTAAEFSEHFRSMRPFDNGRFALSGFLVTEPCVIAHPQFTQATTTFSFRKCIFRQGIQIEHVTPPAPNASGCVLSFERCRAPLIAVRGAYRSCAFTSCWVGDVEMGDIDHHRPISLDAFIMGVDPSQRNPECGGHGMNDLTITGEIRQALDLNIGIRHLSLDLGAEPTVTPELGPLFSVSEKIRTTSLALAQYFHLACRGSTPVNYDGSLHHLANTSVIV